jgi:superfamily I DNA/RNA helicase
MLPKGTKLDTWKVTNIIREYTSDQQLANTVRKVIGLAKHKALGILEPVEPGWFYDLLQTDPDVDPEHLDAISSDCCEIFFKTLDVDKAFDFDDQVYLPVYHNRKLSSAAVVFVDEAQDLSPIQHLMLARIEGARIIAVGDRAQAIYAFRGADGRSMDTLKQRFSMRELPLSITYRVPERIAMLAQSRVPDLQWSKPGGEVAELEALPRPSDYDRDGIILCRNNKPLFAIALEFLRDRIPCRLMTNMGMELTKFIGKLEGTTSRDALRSLEQWRVAQLDKAKSDARISAIIERYDCVKPFLEEYKLKMQAQHALNSVIASESGIRICTIHKSKGLEAKSVYFVKPELLNLDEEQEQNLYYVAVTRALNKLHFYREAV